MMEKLVKKKPDYIYYSTEGSEPPTDVNGQYQIIQFPTLERPLPEKETINHDPNKTYVFLYHSSWSSRT